MSEADLYQFLGAAFGAFGLYAFGRALVAQDVRATRSRFLPNSTPEMRR